MTDRAECNRLSDVVTALAQGRFDEVGPEEMADVEHHLNQCGDCAALLNDAAPAPGRPLDVDVTAPSKAQWDQAWQRIDAATAKPARQRRHPLQLARNWAFLSAAAAVVLAAGLWQWHDAGLPSNWDLRLAGSSDVTIESIEVFGDSTAMVMNTGEADNATIIWVMEDEE